MTKYPNREALRKAHDIYRDAMREFIFQYLEKRVENETVDDLIMRVLNREQQRTIDIKGISVIFRNRECWNDFFSQKFEYDRLLGRHRYDIRSVTSLIVMGRNQVSHPGSRDLDFEYTCTHLFLIAEVLGEVGKTQAKTEVKEIWDELFSDDAEERIANLTKQLEDMLNQLNTVEAEKTKYGKALKAASNRLAALRSVNAQLEKRLETTSIQLKDVKGELAACKTEVEKRNEKVVAPRPASDFPYTGSQLRDYRTKAGLTQVAVALALGLSEGSAAAVGDWEADREKVPPKHYAKLKKLYSLEVLPGNGKARKKKMSIAERYAAETTEEERNELAVKIAELRINEEGTQGLAWRKIREELGLKNEEFHKVIRHEDHYKESCIQRIESFEGGWEYGGKLDVLLGFDPVGELLDRIKACKPASKVKEPAETEDPKSEESQADEDSVGSSEVSAEVPSYRENTAKLPKSQRRWRRPGAVAALRDPAEIREAEAKIANILNPSEKTRLELELREAKRAVYDSEI